MDCLIFGGKVGGELSELDLFLSVASQAFISLPHEYLFFSSLRLLPQKARHRDNDPAAATLANFFKGLYFRRWKTWMLHTLYIDALCYKVSVCHMFIVLDIIFIIQWLLEKKLRCFVMLITLLLWAIWKLYLVCAYLARSSCLSDSFQLTSTLFHGSVNKVKFWWSISQIL